MDRLGVADLPPPRPGHNLPPRQHKPFGQPIAVFIRLEPIIHEGWLDALLNSDRYHYSIDFCTGDGRPCKVVAHDPLSVTALIETLRELARLGESKLQVSLHVKDAPQSLGIKPEELVKR